MLDALSALNHKEDNILVNFYNKDTFQFESDGDMESLINLENDLEEFIRNNVIVDEEKISYLAPLTEFKKPINIFSMNFDTCIEMLCMKNKLTYTD